MEKAGGNDLSQTLHEYDLAGNVKTVEEQYFTGNLPNRSVSNSYDNANRLIEESIDLDSNGTADTTTTYVYDAANNRKEKTIVGGTLRARLTGSTQSSVCFSFRPIMAVDIMAPQACWQQH